MRISADSRSVVDISLHTKRQLRLLFNVGTDQLPLFAMHLCAIYTCWLSMGETLAAATKKQASILQPKLKINPIMIVYMVVLSDVIWLDWHTKMVYSMYIR